MLNITDGVLDECDVTVDELITASSHSLSSIVIISIIGVGNSVDCTRMETLDGDGDKPYLAEINAES